MELACDTSNRECVNEHARFIIKKFKIIYVSKILVQEWRNREDSDH